MITIVDYGMGNFGSFLNMFRRIGVQASVVSDATSIGSAEKILLPGVGAFDAAMERIKASGLREVLDRKALFERVPMLGGCLGMQLMTRASEEGSLSGLGWVEADTRRFPMQNGLKVPHMGWNLVNRSTVSKLTEGFDDETRFYFVHSFFVAVDKSENSILKTTYGIEFDSAIQRENIFGVQFHPEKSHKFGMRLLKNFADV